MPNNALYPYLTEPKETPAIWGGDALVKVYGKTGDPNAKLGESWECWDENLITNGPLAGNTIADLRAKLGADFVGDLDPAQIFPILTKIIDARAALSVQVHPDDAYAQRVEHQPNGKTECWYILHAQPGAQLVLGWNKDTDKAEYERRVADGSLGDILRRVPVNAGDVFYLPAGTLHAIEAGIILFETQQASDLTYRIFDWNRVDGNGTPRELHIAKAADVLNYHQSHAGSIKTLAYESDGLRHAVLIATPRFVVEKLCLATASAMLLTQGQPLILMALNNSVDLTANGQTVTVKPYQTALIPAAAKTVAVSASIPRAELLFVTPPQSLNMLEQALTDSGLSEEAVRGFFAQFAAPR
ncbi:MAG: class I mannose-6-phosphate isomerase [Candidatus Eremiobacteraeota bacterium]|nr:class I mannose-6-phosphate isomerase [Candidatus Eremiobacteraeota bacterium]